MYVRMHANIYIYTYIHACLYIYTYIHACLYTNTTKTDGLPSAAMIIYHASSHGSASGEKLSRGGSLTCPQDSANLYCLQAFKMVPMPGILCKAAEARTWTRFFFEEQFLGEALQVAACCLSPHPGDLPPYYLQQQC